MLNIRTILLITLGLAVAVDAMGFILADYQRHRQSNYDHDDDCECEPVEPTSKPPTTPKSTTSVRPPQPPTSTTEAPTTEAPNTEAPTTEAPITEAPNTEAPTTEAPTTEAPITEAPTTEAPTTEAPITEAPTTEAPTTTTEEPTTTRPKRWVCPGESQLFERVPTENNSQTSRWCIGLTIQNTKIPSTIANDLCAQMNGGVLTAFENADEQSFFSHIAYLEFLRRNITMGSITVDGRRKPECINNSTKNVPPCTKTGTFAMVDTHTDPTYMFTKWYAGQPDGNNIVINGNYIIESCIHLYILKDLYTKYDGYYNDMYCDYAVSPTNSGQIYSSYGAVCGWEPRYQDTDVWA